MNYHNITTCDMLNGDGLRTVLWVSGCPHKCKGCHNSETWNQNSGILFDKMAENELLENLKEDYISGITFSGGDPLMNVNRAEIERLVRLVKNKFPKKTIWLYTGFLWEEIKDLSFIHLVDVLVDGKFILEQKDNNLKWKGSGNQRVIDVQKTLKTGKIVLHTNN